MICWSIDTLPRYVLGVQTTRTARLQPLAVHKANFDGVILAIVCLREYVLDSRYRRRIRMLIQRGLEYCEVSLKSQSAADSGSLTMPHVASLPVPGDTIQQHTHSRGPNTDKTGHW